MNKLLNLLIFVSFFCSGLTPALANKIDTSTLQSLHDSGSKSFKSIANAVNEAVLFSTSKSPRRAKLPGAYRYFLDMGGSIFDIDDSLVAAVTSSSYAPDSFKNFHLKAGLGFPYGLYADLGFSYVLSNIHFGAVHGNIAFQALDLANVVYTDMVPCLSFSVGANYTLSGPSFYGIQGQMLLGAYHRFLGAQVSYIFQVSYGELTGITPSQNRLYFRNGLSSYWPLFEGFYLTQDVFIQPIEASASIGYQF